jgi:predicted ribosome quality control (RQC) complex YloA/Tae2 family protein
MNQELIQQIVAEARERIAGRFLGKIFQLTPLAFVIDFGTKGTLLLVSGDPTSPRFYFTERRIKDLEKQSLPISHFGLLLRTKLGSGELIDIAKEPGERVVRLTFRVTDDHNETIFRRLVVQLTGKAANLFLVDELDQILGALRNPRGPNQQLGEIYKPPATQISADIREVAFPVGGSASQAADEYFKVLDETQTFDVLAKNARNRLRQLSSRQQKLKTNLLKDIEQHGDPEEHKRLGDLLLASIATAVRTGNKVKLVDYYSEGTPAIEVELDEKTSLQDQAQIEFRRYTKAKRARDEISQRLATVESELEKLQTREQKLERLVAAKDEVGLREFDGVAPKSSERKKVEKEAPKIPGVRKYRSTDGYEILVGRAARDNDNLTFKIAKPHDLWMHAGDYPGSHVIIRNPTRQEIPQRTIIEAAQLAGRFSQASEDSKVVIHYAERKFLSKPKGSAPGLVRMSSFRSITVEPRESIERI